MKRLILIPLCLLAACLAFAGVSNVEFYGTPDKRLDIWAADGSSLVDISNVVSRLQPGGIADIPATAGEMGALFTVTNVTLRSGTNSVTVAGTNAIAWDGFRVYEPGTTWVCFATNGAISNLVQMSTRSNFQAYPNLPFSEIIVAGTTYGASLAVPLSNRLHVTYGASGVTADFEVVRYSGYTVLTLKNLSDTTVTNLTMFKASSLAKDFKGGIYFGIASTTNYAISVLPLTQDVQVQANSAGQVYASVYPVAVGWSNQSIAIVSCPQTNVMAAAEEIQLRHAAPRHNIGGIWSKLSPNADLNYLFVDLCETNADEIIDYAVMGGFGYVMPYMTTAFSSYGKYPINTNYYPNGLIGLKRVADKLHARGLKLGLHTSSGAVSLTDAFATNYATTGFLMGPTNWTYGTLTTNGTSLACSNTLATSGGDYWIIGYGLTNAEVCTVSRVGTNMTISARGRYGTMAYAHAQGEVVRQIYQLNSRFLVDTDGPLKNAWVSNMNFIVTYSGADMVYFDYEDYYNSYPHSWRRIGALPVAFAALCQRDVRIQGSQISPWGWWVADEIVLSDFAYTGVKMFLDYQRLGYSYNLFKGALTKVDMGWMGFLARDAGYPATTPDEAEMHSVRQLAHNQTISWETTLARLRDNGRTAEAFGIIKRYDTIRRSGAASQSVCDSLKTNEWTLRNNAISQVKYEVQRYTNSFDITNSFGSQPMALRFENVGQINISSTSNLTLCLATNPVLLATLTNWPGPGYLIGKMTFANSGTNQASVFSVGAGTNITGTAAPGSLNLTAYRSLAITLCADSAPPSSGLSNTINFQITDGTYFRDHYVPVTWQGTNTVIITEPDTTKMLVDYWPYYSYYSYLFACGPINLSAITALNVRLAKQNATAPSIRLSSVVALAETPVSITNPVVTVGARSMTLPFTLTNGCYVEYRGYGYATNYTRDGVMLGYAEPTGSIPILTNGVNTVSFTPTNTAAKITVITTNTPIASFAL